MAEFEEKLQSILGNPELMGQIMSMAGSMNQQPPPPPPQPGQPPGAVLSVPRTGDRIHRCPRAASPAGGR